MHRQQFMSHPNQRPPHNHHQSQGGPFGPLGAGLLGFGLGYFGNELIGGPQGGYPYPPYQPYPVYPPPYPYPPIGYGPPYGPPFY